ncbi:MAG: hypothetical protein ACK4F6_09035 [Hylemonella sp.]
MTSPNRIFVRTKKKTYQRQYDGEVAFDLGAFAGISPEWVEVPLIELALRSQLRREHHQRVVNLKVGLSVTSELPAWQALTKEPPSAAKLEQLVKYFTELEQHLTSRRGTPLLQDGRISAITRAFVHQTLKKKSFDDRMARIRVSFVTTLPTKSKGRLLISDHPIAGRGPLSAIPHESLQDLHQKVTQTLESDMDRVRQACIYELDEYERVKAMVQKASALTVPLARESEIRVALAGSYMCRRQLLQGPDTAAVLAVALRAEAHFSSPLAKVDDKMGCTAGSWDLVRMLDPPEGYGQNIQQLANVEVAPPVRLLFACALLLQIHTGWNFSSIVDLELQGMVDVDADTWLQSIKAKTHDQTPPVVVSKNDEAVARVILLLRNRLAMLKERGWVEADESRLWLTFRSIHRHVPQNVINWSSARHAFLARHKLPYFSGDQVRVQKLAQIATGPGGVNAAQLAAGHLAIQTTMAYVQKMLLERRNASILLEFERRFDATVRFLIDKDSVDAEQRIIAYPIGDGTSCVDPFHPPDDDWMKGGVCTATECHSGDGCPNRQIKIDEKRLEELCVTHKFYRENWNRMCNENEAEFNRFHLSPMLFNFALYHYIGNGPYRHLLSNED